MKLLDRYVIGYEKLQPGIMAALALKQHIYIEGGHGVGKTTLGKCLAKAVDPEGNSARYYDCTKADIASIGGILDIKAMSERGELAFSKHNQSIFGATVVIADELPRSSKERQNLWLEVLQDGTFYGIPLRDLHTVIASGNPMNYKGNHKMDPALKSRFIFFLTLNLKDLAATNVGEIIDLHLGGRTGDHSDIRKIIEDMRESIERDRKDKNLTGKIRAFISHYIEYMNKKAVPEDGNDIVPREYVQLMDAILALKAYYQIMGHPEPLPEAGKYAIENVINTKHAESGAAFIGQSAAAFSNLVRILKSTGSGPKAMIELEYAICNDIRSKVEFWRKHIVQVISEFKQAEIIHMAQETLGSLNGTYVAQFYNIMSQHNETKQVSQEVEGLIITEAIRKFREARNHKDLVVRNIHNELSAKNNWSSEDIEKILSC